MFFIDLEELQLVGASPELLVKVDDGIIVNHPIAGTRPRGKTDVIFLLFSYYFLIIFIIFLLFLLFSYYFYYFILFLLLFCFFYLNNFHFIFDIIYFIFFYIIFFSFISLFFKFFYFLLILKRI